MSGSSFGTIFKITTWGESHGKGLGVVIDGCPAGLPLDEKIIQEYLNRRRPGQSAFTTPRSEADSVEILSGVFEGRTTGTPISLLVHNESQRSLDYSEIAGYYRPGHADYTYDCKYGFRDYRGGGRSSGRETIGRVAAGAVAVQLLRQLGIDLLTYTKSIGNISVSSVSFDPKEINRNPFYMPDSNAAAKAGEYVTQLIKEQDSCGGVIECSVSGLPSGIGEPVFSKLDALLSDAIVSIGAVKAIEFGDGIAAAHTTGSVNNDSFVVSDGIIRKATNHSGGILGGISDGSNLVLRAYVKPTPSISRTQQTANCNGENIEININGRHDPVIVPRAVVVVEAMTALTLVDLLLMNLSSKMDSIISFYK